MEIKRIVPRVYDRYDALLEENISSDNIEHALRRFVRDVENGKEIPVELLKFISRWVKEVYNKSENLNPWEPKKRGRPTSKHPNNFLFMLAWYRSYLDPQFCKIPKNAEGHYKKIADSFKKDDLQYLFKHCRLSFLLY